MDAIRQYLELYAGHRELFDNNSAHVLNRLRRDAYAALEGTPLPRLGSENYHITDLTALLSPDFGLNPARVPLDVNPMLSFRCGVPNLSTAVTFMLNDIYAEPEGTALPRHDGIIIGSLRRAAEEHPELVRKYYGTLAGLDNPIAALDTLLVQDGLFVYVPEGVRPERPVQLVNVLQSAMPLMAVRRLLVVLEEDAELQLLVCDHTQNPDNDFLALQTVEIFAGARSRLDIYDIEESTPRTTRLCTTYLRQEEGANVLLDGITLCNGRTRNEYRCTFAGPEGELRLLGMAIEDSERMADTYSVIRHDAPRCHSDELFKYVVDDKARGEFAGLIYVAPGSVKTEAYQANRNIVGSPEARMYSKPQLEIYNDDVKCSHGTATGTFDPKQVFYMRQRGLSEAQAHLLLKQAFMADVIEGVRLPALRERLTQLVEHTFTGTQNGCAACSAACPHNSK